MMVYDPSRLASWRSVLSVSGTAVADPELWKMVGRYVCLSLVTGIFLIAVVPDVHLLSSALFLKAVNVIKVFLPFVLGLYLKSCLDRWWITMSRFSNYFCAIKKVMLVLNSVQKGPEGLERRATVRRLAIVSCHLLDFEVRTMWWELKRADEELDITLALCALRGFLHLDEAHKLRSAATGTHVDVVWTWIGQVLTHADSGHQPPMAARLQALSSMALQANQLVKTSVALQFPFMYSHMVALLVHTNNVLVAVANGVSFATLSTRVVAQFHAFRRKDPLLPGEDPRAMFYESLQGFSMVVLAVVIEPLVYQAFWHVASCLNDPFSSASHAVDVGGYVQELAGTLEDMDRFACHTVIKVLPPTRDVDSGEDDDMDAD